jgi:hypothetical protein
MKKLVAIFILASCTTESGPASPCYNLCQELVQTCEYSAYPSFSSCEEGCLYYQEEGANIEEQLTCIQEAECNEFAVIECENEHGVDNESE